ncbi:MAG TPA: hypothetical protein VFT72_03440 [Opitutaceae bacterium]|nr:hypothetical protein [Opitutaceae bacterium]
MKCCFCFFGLNRSLSKTIASIEQRIFGPVREAGIEFAVYAAFMDPGETFTNYRSGEVGCAPERGSEQLLGAKKIVMIDQTKADQQLDQSKAFSSRDPWGDHYTSVRNACRALVSLDAVTTLWEENETNVDETVFVYLRPDMIYHDSLPLQDILTAFQKYGPNLFLTPFWATFGGLNDRMAVLGSHAARAYGHRIQIMDTFLTEVGAGMHAETFVHYVASKIPTALDQPALQLTASRLRSNGKLRREYFSNTSGKRLAPAWASRSFFAACRGFFPQKYEEISAEVRRVLRPIIRGRHQAG